MTTTLFYFSGTGNSLKVARDLAAELGDTNIVSIPKAIKETLDLSAKHIGIIFPVYMFGLPLIVKEFIKKLHPAKGRYIFSIATYGGKAANTLGIGSQLFKNQGLELSAGFLVKMPGNYTPLYGAIAQDKQNILFEKEKLKIKEIAAIIKTTQVHKVEKDLLFFRWLFSAIYKLAGPKIPLMDKDFWADQNCNSCGICVKVCPINNIELQDGRPKWLHHCQQCMACLQWCPKEAIQYGKSTVGRKRFHHPDIKLQDLYAV